MSKFHIITSNCRNYFLDIKSAVYTHIFLPNCIAQYFAKSVTMWLKLSFIRCNRMRCNLILKAGRQICCSSVFQAKEITHSFAKSQWQKVTEISHASSQRKRTSCLKLCCYLSLPFIRLTPSVCRRGPFILAEGGLSFCQVSVLPKWICQRQYCFSKIIQKAAFLHKQALSLVLN